MFLLHGYIEDFNFENGHVLHASNEFLIIAINPKFHFDTGIAYTSNLSQYINSTQYGSYVWDVALSESQNLPELTYRDGLPEPSLRFSTRRQRCAKPLARSFGDEPLLRYQRIAA